LTGTYSELLDYVVFAVVLFYALTIAGVFQLRRTRPEAPRPYRAWGYPVLPAIYIAFALFVEWALLTHKAGRSLAGLSIVAVGVPVFFLWRGRAVTSGRQTSEVTNQKSEVRSQKPGVRR
jgi:APA family basic amino acid/polyamine antiporter